MSSNKDNSWMWAILFHYLNKEGKNENKEKHPVLHFILGITILFVVLFIVAVILTLFTGIGKGIEKITTEGDPSLLLFMIAFIAIPILAIVGIVKLYKKLTYKKRHTKEVNNDICQYIDEEKYTAAIDYAEREKDFLNADNAYYIGNLCYKGLGCDRNSEKAFEYFTLAQDGNTEAKAQCGAMLLWGLGCTQDIELGKQKITETSATSTMASTLEDTYILTGDYGFTKNTEYAMHSLRLKIDEGNTYAMFVVGKALYEGIEGVKQDKENGLALIKRAANSNDYIEDAREYLKNLGE